jgi:type II secretory pathway component PulF
MTADDLITLNEEIAGMARAGLPLDQGLAALAREMGKGRLQKVTAKIAVDLHAGFTLPEALDRQGKRVPRYYASLVAAGIRSGSISEVLATLTRYARSLADLRTTVIGAIFYPCVVLFFAFVLFGFFCYLVLPQYDATFQSMNVGLPAITWAALFISRHPIEFLVAPFAAIVVYAIVLKVVLRFSARARRAWARFTYVIPIIGTLIRSTRLAAFAELLGILVDHEVPLPEAIQLAGEASSDPILAAAAEHIEKDLSQGLPLGEALRSRGRVPELIAWITGLGERQGNLGDALHQVAEVYRRQVELRAAILRNVLPPFVIILTGGVLVGLFVLTIMLPMYRVLEGLSK